MPWLRIAVAATALIAGLMVGCGEEDIRFPGAPADTPTPTVTSTGAPTATPTPTPTPTP